MLRNARINPAEKQTLLAHTQNSTSSATIREALITWWENEDEVRHHDGGPARAYFVNDGEYSETDWTPAPETEWFEDVYVYDDDDWQWAPSWESGYWQDEPWYEDGWYDAGD